MKTLERFWHWVDNEKPEAVPVLQALVANVSQSARDTLGDAARYIATRAGKPYALSFAFERHPEALRDLSLALCRALDAMEAVVPEAPAPPPEPETPWWKTQADAMDHTADALLRSLSGVSEMHRAARSERRDRYAAMYEGTGSLLAAQNALLAEIDQAERLKPRGVIFYDPAKVTPETLGDLPDFRVLAGAPPKPPKRLPWVSLTGCPGCGCSDDLYHMDTCPFINATPERWERAKATQAEQRLLAACDQSRDLTVPPTGRIIPE